MKSRALWIIALLTAAQLCGCISVRSQPRLFVFSEPSGAAVYIDGTDTGFTTPAQLDASSADITVVKEGYIPQTRTVQTVVDFRYPRWQDGGTADYTIAFCLFRTSRDFFFPFQFFIWEYPRRLFFRLEPEGS